MTDQTQNPTIVIEDDNQDAASETFHDEGIKNLKLITLLQNIFVLGMTSVHNWEVTLNFMKRHPDVTKHPLILQIWFNLNKMFQMFQTHVYEKAGASQKRLDDLRFADYTWEELTNILKPLINKKPLKDQEYSFEICQTVMNVVREVLQTDETDETEKHKTKEPTKNLKRSRAPSVSSNAASDDDDSDEDQFSKIFKTDKKKATVISQVFQYRSGEKTKRMTTSGEVGTHLVKIEITDTKDLKNCKSDKFYWQKVSKKGLFLLDVKNNQEDANLYKQIDKMLVKVGERVSKMEGVKLNEFASDYDVRKK